MLSEFENDIASLLLYRGIIENPAIRFLKEISGIMASRGDGKKTAVRDQLSSFAHYLWDIERPFADLILDLIIYDDNPFSRGAELSGMGNMEAGLIAATQSDLSRLHGIFHLDLVQVARSVDLELILPEQHLNTEDGNADIRSVFARSSDWPVLIEDLASHYKKYSRGVIARFRAFTWDPTTGLRGIKRPDPISLSDIVGYKEQVQLISNNTEKLLQRKPANHILLHGPRGTGKSSIVKALLNEYRDVGLRLVELSRENLQHIDQLVEMLQNYAPAFIIFIDDLSFEDYETEYKGFKAVLEGSVTARPKNILVYATSNRRHLIRELFSDRRAADEEIHAQETMQEKLSLADRFGLSIRFPPPSSQLYLEMIEKMALDAGIDMDRELLRRRALEWERLRHGPSGRAARQFVDSLEQRYYK